ncbi:hypothetical protein GCM10028796_41900 [Ramlibacter monticola]|uniref:Uncharacterized protein n=1 Tax=Ramlibacter monticola TaxID=1926872 RepID=A0A937CTY3_9BURK|nr:hypothetical protein [Ramlibacter monticola]MBL0392791.1 hypothetical protein [Ramlibacter monticola]
MDRLQAELQRLFLSPDPAPPGQARAMVLGVSGPDSWDRLGKAWQGVQADLQLPAPGIAVSGTDAHQLWFSLAEPVPAARASAFLDALRRRYLAEVPPGRVAMAPSEAMPQAGALPPAQVAPGRWSAFVAHDLAALFAEEHWLDLEPTPEAQADLLSRLQCMRPADFARSLALAGPADAEPAPAARAAQQPDPRRFLLEVMNDHAVELQLRIEAAKALLPYCEGPAGARR